MNHFGQHLRSGVQTSSNTTSLATTSCRSARHRSRKAHAFRPSAADVTDGSSQEQQTVQWRDARLLENLERLYHLSPLHSLSYAGSTQQHDIADPLWSHGVFSVSLDDKPPETKKGSQEKCSDYYANVGDAIRTLRDDIPHLFDRKLNYDIYREDISFRDPRNTFSGMKNYRLIFWSLRFHGRIFFKKLYVEVRRIWQPQDGLICMRWTVHGVPRVPWEAEGTFDGISQYKLDSQGKIYEHAVDNVILRDPPMQGIGPLLAGLNLVPGQPQQPVPGAWFKGLEEGAAAAANAAANTLDGSNSWLTAIVHFSWVHLYAASLGTMQLQGREQLVPATAAVAATTADHTQQYIR